MFVKLGRQCRKTLNCKLKVKLLLGLKEIGFGTAVTKMNLYHHFHTESRLFTFAG